jgi:hypothetical protein
MEHLCSYFWADLPSGAEARGGQDELFSVTIPTTIERLGASGDVAARGCVCREDGISGFPTSLLLPNFFFLEPKARSRGKETGAREAQKLDAIEIVMEIAEMPSPM